MLERLAGRWLEITATALIAYLVLSNASAFGNIISSLSSGFSQSVRTLQAR